MSVSKYSWPLNDVDDNAYLKFAYACVNMKVIRLF